MRYGPHAPFFVEYLPSGINIDLHSRKRTNIVPKPTELKAEYQHIAHETEDTAL